ncbi:hypothetical protein N665_0017s0039 [Sinapis alba]|nr:hypothetical protein N665_0017s0039 [Sinapis alba]
MNLIFETQIGSSFSIEVGYFDNVLEIKEKIEKYRFIHVSKQILVYQGKVLQGDHNIEQCGLFNNSRIQFFISLPDSHVKLRMLRRLPQRLKVMILPHSHENEPVSKVPVSVMANENVEKLRKELEKLRERNELKLHILKRNVLDDDRSFLWNGVAHSDTFEVFLGHVT